MSIAGLVTACGYTTRHGIFTVGLAVGLKQHGLRVCFHSDPDNNIGGYEKRCYGRARRAGVLRQPALELSTVLRERRRGHIPIVFFNTDSNVGHFSPLLGVRNGELQLPLAEGGKLDEEEFLVRWSEPEILRQCVIVGR